MEDAKIDQISGKKYSDQTDEVPTPKNGGEESRGSVPEKNPRNSGLGLIVICPEIFNQGEVQTNSEDKQATKNIQPFSTSKMACARCPSPTNALCL